MATWNLESVGTKGYGGGGSYLCARAAKALIRKKKNDAQENYDGVGIFKDPLMDSAYGQCTSTTRSKVAAEVEELMKPTELEQALAQARAACPPPEAAHRVGGGDEGEAQNRRNFSVESLAREEVQVVFEAPFTSRGGRKGTSIPLVCMGTGEHAVYVLKVSYNGRRWSVERRYSEFDEVDKALARAFGKDSNVKLPTLPSKVWVGGLSKENLEKRKSDLEAYLQRIVAQSKLVRECAELRAFLEIPPAPSATRPQPAQGGGPGRRRQEQPKLNGDKPDLNGVKSQGRMRQAQARSHLNGQHLENGLGGSSGAGGSKRAQVPRPRSNGTRDEDEISL